MGNLLCHRGGASSGNEWASEGMQWGYAALCCRTGAGCCRLLWSYCRAHLAQSQTQKLNSSFFSSPQQTDIHTFKFQCSVIKAADKHCVTSISHHKLRSCSPRRGIICWLKSRWYFHNKSLHSTTLSEKHSNRGLKTLSFHSIRPMSLENCLLSSCYRRVSVDGDSGALIRKFPNTRLLQIKSSNH